MAKREEKIQSLGERIRMMRERQHLNIKQLAEKTGYKEEYLNKIEEGKISPPVGALISISRALAVDSKTLLSEDRRKRRQSYVKRTKAYAYRSLTPDAEDKHLWAYLVALEPKKQHEMVAYKHEGEEFMYVLEGRVEITVGEEAHELKKGQTIHFNSGVNHKLKNLSSKESKLIVVVYTP
jgi:quercetin dioxygenase-like cupin family protein